MAYGLLTGISQNEDERARFRARRKFQMDVEHNRIVSFEEGKREGIEAGIEVGKREGMEEGIEVGKREVARKLLSSKVSLDLIAQSTGLSQDEIQALTS
jgi:predicted transposase/invertase (TIGR01784 family)